MNDMSEYSERVSGKTRVHDRRDLLESQTTVGEIYLSLIFVLVKSSRIYAIGSMASPLLALILLPFLTYTISHAELTVTLLKVLKGS